MIKTKNYVISGKDGTGQRLFLAHDSHSGGYPYATPFIGSAQTTSDAIQAVKWIQEATSQYCNLRDVNVYNICLEEVDVSQIEKTTRNLEKYVEALNEEEKNLLKKVLQYK